MRSALWIGSVLLALHATSASACGHCVEDKVAAVYDYAVVTQAKAQKHHVVYFALDGTVVPGAALHKRIETAIQSTPGVDQSSVRVSLELAALSFSFDPRRTSYAGLQKALERKLTGEKLGLMELKYIN
ncbi:MAG: hypothetical protein JSS58_01530 [Proteobacteria bacterium]|nr:hypothetical protein [Pseudomonadota bacterium]